jgi:hypothetical protein
MGREATMSDPITWHALTPKEQNRLVATTLFGWQAEPCPEQGKEWGEAALDRYETSRKWYCVRCKISQGDIEGWESVPHNPVNICPNYATDWNAAMQVFHKVAGDYNEARYETHTMQLMDFAEELLKESGWSVSNEMYPAEAMLAVVATWTPERICIAALRAYGVEVIESEEQPA